MVQKRLQSLWISQCNCLPLAGCPAPTTPILASSSLDSVASFGFLSEVRRFGSCLECLPTVLQKGYGSTRVLVSVLFALLHCHHCSDRLGFRADFLVINESVSSFGEAGKRGHGRCDNLVAACVGECLLRQKVCMLLRSVDVIDCDRVGVECHYSLVENSLQGH